MEKKAIMEFEDLFKFEIRQLYSMEQQLIEALPKMTAKAGNNGIKRILKEHKEETIAQRDRLKKIADKFGIDPDTHIAQSMQALIAEAENILGSYEIEKSIRDAMILMFAQRIEHMEISAYGAAAEHSEFIGDNFITDLLKESMDEEKSADEKLKKVAKSTINEKASKLTEPSNFYGRHG